MNKENKYTKVLLNGLITENPTLVQLIGMCPTLAVTTTLQNGVTMGIAATLVLIASNVVYRFLRKFIPDKDSYCGLRCDYCGICVGD